MGQTIRPRAGIDKIALYQGGASTLPGRSSVLKLSSNENPMGPPPAAIEAIREAMRDVHLYPPTDHAALRVAIGEVHGLDPERIICGVGSDEVLQIVTQGFAGPGDEIIHTAHGFSLYPALIHMAGATPVCVEECERVVDVDAILTAITPSTRVVLVTNPGNPTGTMLHGEDLARLADGVPEEVVLVLDGAYTEFTEDFDGGAALATERDNVLMTRTFSKIYGLGGLRIGWGYGARPLIETMLRLRQPFNLSKLQMDAAAAAVRDRVWFARCRKINAEQRARLTGALRQLGIAVDDSVTNFVLARFADADEAEAANAALASDGIVVRMAAGYGFPEGLRITVGDATMTGRVIDVLTRFREAAA